MDPHNPPYRMAMRSHIRSQMQMRGLLEFCEDEEVDTVQDLELAYMNAALDWRDEADQLTQLPLCGVAATSTDHPLQSIGAWVLDWGVPQRGWKWKTACCPAGRKSHYWDVNFPAG